MHEIIHCSDAEFIVRASSVDRQSVEWVARSSFVEVMRAVDIGAADAVLDLGAHIGSFAIFTALEKGCTVVGCEPDASSLRIARANVLLNRLEDRAEIHHYAVGGREGAATLYEATETWAHTLIAGGGPFNELTGRSAEVPLITLERAIDLLDGRHCALAKFNIEGAEHEMLEAAHGDALRRIDLLVGEIHEDLGEPRTDEHAQKLRECGFHVEVRAETGAGKLLLARRPRGR